MYILLGRDMVTLRTDVTLYWRQFRSLREARSVMGALPCVYIQADRGKRPLRIGKAPHGLAGQFRGVLAEAFDSAAHGSGNLFFVAPVNGPSCDAVERELLWRLRGLSLYNDTLPSRRPATRVALRHRGDQPRLPRPGASSLRTGAIRGAAHAEPEVKRKEDT